MTSVVLDVTRTVSPKSIATPTGIDRVERAYVSYFLSAAPDALYVCKSGRRYHLLDHDSMSAVFASVLEGDEGAGLKHLQPGLLGWMFGGREQKTASQLGFPDAFTYLNVGHSNLSETWLRSLRDTGAQKIIGLVHDMIPMDAPEFQTDQSVQRFEKRMRALSAHADLVVTNSIYTKERVGHWFGTWGHMPPIIANPLGVDPLVEADPMQSDRPYFVVLGTIEPRKNHALLLRVWEGFQEVPEADRPMLHIIGRRGWMNEEVFSILDRSPMMGRDVFEHGSLSDEEVSGYLRGAKALLFPSFTEGYGLPLLEALSVGTPTIVADLQVFRELSGPLSLYLNPFDDRIWKKEIMKQAQQGNPAGEIGDLPPFDVPKWVDHFALLEQLL